MKALPLCVCMTAVLCRHSPPMVARSFSLFLYVSLCLSHTFHSPPQKTHLFYPTASCEGGGSFDSRKAQGVHIRALRTPRHLTRARIVYREGERCGISINLLALVFLQRQQRLGGIFFSSRSHVEKREGEYIALLRIARSLLIAVVRSSLLFSASSSSGDDTFSRRLFLRRSKKETALPYKRHSLGQALIVSRLSSEKILGRYDIGTLERAGTSVLFGYGGRATCNLHHARGRETPGNMLFVCVLLCGRTAHFTAFSSEAEQCGRGVA